MKKKKNGGKKGKKYAEVELKKKQLLRLRTKFSVLFLFKSCNPPINHGGM